MTLPSIPRRFALLVLIGLLPFGIATAEVTRVEITQRLDIGTSGYEKLVGTLHFQVDPGHPRNRIIADLERAPTNRAGRVAFSSDFFMLQPKDASRSNGTALEISNRGSKNGTRLFNRGLASDPVSEAGPGGQISLQPGIHPLRRGLGI